MKSKVKKIINILSLLFIFICNIYSSAFSVENKIILKIDNNLITTVDIFNEARYLQTLNPNLKNLEKFEIFEIAKNSLIRENVKIIEISKNKLNKIDENYLKNIIQNIYKNIGFNTKKEFLDYIKNSSIDINEIEKKLLIEAKWNQLIYRKFYSKLKKPDVIKIKKDIQANKKFTNSYLLFEILFTAKKNEEAKEKYIKILNTIDSKGFENAAAIFSSSESSKTGGKLGWVNENSLNKKILREISKIKIEEVTKPILIPGGFLILYLKDIKKTENKIDLDKEVSMKIRSLQNDQLNQYSNIYYNKVKKDIDIYER